ncbi:efflux RND transporter periplasmic adaptor subunit [Atopomonas sediminilitoris]|uniref:efflux RND transporter periplasmic adaptor subunit n=1 Tax=Atopomonas sediminilitoris TaxID=2919919 RepID=UPI001F4DF40F|nr:efflux RND transporter periplasmic adaptor subunit [Atopomonas sediminilitoris]MCJ8169658.1 efflux RND transporter periplasmic adaptor subunit [Atopomonas sediminilitoris]
MRPLKPLTLLLLPLLITACDQEQVPPAKEVVRPVKLIAVADLSTSLVREFPARIQATQEAELSFRVSGELKEFPVLQGQRVKKGDLIAKLDPADYNLQVKDRQATYDLARAQFGRMAKLVEREMVSRSEYDQKKAQMDSAEASLRMAKQELDYTNLRAPYDSIIAATYLDNFQVVQAKQPVVKIQAGNLLDATFQVPENMLTGINTEQRGYHPQVRLDSADGAIIDSVVKEFSTIPDPKTLSYQVTVSFEKPTNFTALPGMSATVIVDFSKLYGDTFIPQVVPVEAVFSPDQDNAKKQVVWIAQADEQGTLRVTQREVKVGQITGKGLQILEGLQAGDQVVTAGGRELRDNAAVKPWVRERGL